MISVVTGSGATYATSPPESFSNQALKDAGWTAQQIAELREKTGQSGSAQLAPDLGFRSVFDNYVPHSFVPDIGWREANDRVGEIGGWRAYLKLVQEAAQLEKQSESGDRK